MISLPKKSGRRRTLWLLLVLVGVIALERGLGYLFGALVGYSFEEHPLGAMYAKFVRMINTVFVALVLIAGIGKLRRMLPKLYVLMAGLLLLTLWTTIVMVAFGRESSWAFRASMWHMAAGQLATPLACAYIFHHVLIYYPGATSKERKSGLRLAAFATIVLLIGALFSVVGGPELLPLLRVHGLGAVLLVLLVVVHIRNRRRQREGAANPVGANSSQFGGRGLWQAVAVSALVPIVMYGFAEGWVPKPVPRFNRFLEPLPRDPYTTESVAADYEQPFGEGAFLPARLQSPQDRLIPARFLNTANSCSYEGCHTDIGKHWAVSGHRHGRNVFVAKVMDEMRGELGPASTRLCAGCHDPVNLLSGEVRQSGHPVTGPENEGVTCLVCHAAPRADAHPSNGSVQLTPTPLFFDRLVERNQYLMTVVFLDQHKQELYHPQTLREPELCGGCHVTELTMEGHSTPLLIQDKVGEWRNGIHSRADGPGGSRSCVDCHMPPVMESYQGRDVRSHRFLSSNTGVPAFYATDERYESYARRYLGGIQQAAFTHAENVSLAQQNIQGAVKLVVRLVGEPSLLASGVRSVPIALTVTNDGVGHKFPAGASDLIDVWLQTEVTDAAGRVVWSQGVPDGDGRLHADTIRFGSEWYDADGRRLMHHELWKLAEIRNDRRIPSGRSDERELRIEVPSDTAWPISVRARLRHRRFNPDFAEWVLGEDSAWVPITDVQDRSIRVALPDDAAGREVASPSAAARAG